MAPNSSLGTRHYRPGQGLLETVVALSILITGAVAMLVLVVSSSTARALAETQTVASNFAREGIEITRNIRDSNWIQNLAFDTGLTAPGNDYTFAPVFDPTANAWSLLASTTAITDPSAILYRYTSGPHNGVTVQSGAGAPALTVATNYRRLLTLDEICVSGAIMTSGSNCAGSKAGIRATSTVQWIERGRTHVISIEERIYDWR